MDIFDFKDHFSYLKAKVSQEAGSWGRKTQLSNYMGVQPAFLSQVLAGKYSLSLEQTDLANQFFGHSPEESDFFILLVSRDRAGTKSLQKFYTKHIDEIINKRLSLIERLGRREDVPDQVQNTYFSSWLYPMIHVMCTVEGLRTRDSIAKHLNLSLEDVDRRLDFLEKSLMIQKINGQFVPTKKWIRLDRKSPHIVKHHTHWRLQAIQNLDTQREHDVHFSGVYSMDKKTAMAIQEQISVHLKSYTQLIESAPEEEVYIMSLDFFKKI